MFRGFFVVKFSAHHKDYILALGIRRISDLFKPQCLNYQIVSITQKLIRKRIFKQVRKLSDTLY